VILDFNALLDEKEVVVSKKDDAQVIFKALDTTIST
jgi:hypothetical protein